MNGMQWRGRLVQGDDRDNPRAYSGVVEIAGFAYRVNIEPAPDEGARRTVMAVVAVEDIKK